MLEERRSLLSLFLMLVWLAVWPIRITVYLGAFMAYFFVESARDGWNHAEKGPDV